LEALAAAETEPYRTPVRQQTPRQIQAAVEAGQEMLKEVTEVLALSFCDTPERNAAMVEL
jgi:hypothetical protein